MFQGSIGPWALLEKRQDIAAIKTFWHTVHMLAAADSQFYVFKFEFSCVALDKKNGRHLS